MQELANAFVQAHPHLVQTGVLACILATALCLFWCWKHRRQVWDPTLNRAPALRLSASDGLLLLCFLLLALVGTISSIYYLLLVVGALSLWKLRTNSILTYLDLPEKAFPRILGRALLIALGIFLPLILFSTGVETLLRLWGYPPPLQPAVELFAAAKNLREVLPALLIAICAAPMGEEFLFRGILYPAAKCHLSPTFAAVLSSFLFAAMHQHLPSFFPLFLFGFLLCRLLEHTGSLWTGILVHASFNALSAACLCIPKFFRHG